MKKIWMGVGLACVLTFAGCGGSDTKTETKAPESAAAPAAAGGSATPDEANGGTITGKVSFDGAAPKLATLDMSANPVCMRAHASGAQKSEEAVVNSNGTLKNVFVWVKAGVPDKQWQASTAPVKLEQMGCMYKPHVIAVMTGQNIQITNDDDTNHNIHPLPQTNQEWNESQGPKADEKLKSFARQEIMIPVKCNIHPWMRSYINVVSHPFFAVTGDDGTFTIKGLPPGTYTVEIKHEKYGAQEQQITVGAKESKTADFSIKG